MTPTRRVILSGTTALRSLLLIAVVGCASPDADLVADKAEPPPAQYGIGHAVDQGKLASLDIDVNPAGLGLPAGSGTPEKGAAVFAQKCASCHGPKGEGLAPVPKLVGREPREGFGFGNDVKLAKTVGNYWPYSTTVFDYVRRTMPFTAPGSLTNDEVYSVVAWLLAENEIIAKDAEMNATSLPAVKMPAAGKFVRDDRTGGRVVR